MYDKVIKNMKTTYHYIHSVLHCKNSECINITMNRDKNASKNILLLTNCKI